MLCERTVGLLVCFLVKAKTEALKCVTDVAAYCQRNGHPMGRLLVDADTVAASADFIRECSYINGLNQRGISVFPAPPG